MHEFIRILMSCRPAAEALISGSEAYSELHGRMFVCAASGGSLVTIEVNGLPQSPPFLAVHIHNGSSCMSTNEKPFSESGEHLNYSILEHPLHTGDLPPLLNNDGYAWISFYTDKFTPKQIIGYPIIIHSMPDDFHTQPSGNAGEKIGCGIIREIRIPPFRTNNITHTRQL